MEDRLLSRPSGSSTSENPGQDPAPLSQPTAVTGSDRRVVVAGGSSGIGMAVVERFAASGAEVFSLARRSAEERLAVQGQVHHRSVDVTDAAALQRCVQGIVDEGDVDVVVYCAGLNVPERRLERLTPDMWRAMIATNLDGAYYTIAACLASLRRRRGVVILISSASALWTNQSGAAYQAAKVGLMALERAANFEEHGEGVRFTTIFPGVVDTPHLDRRPQPPSPSAREQMLTADDVAAACHYVAGLPPRVCVPELVLLPTALQTPGNTCFV